MAPLQFRIALHTYGTTARRLAHPRSDLFRPSASLFASPFRHTRFSGATPTDQSGDPLGSHPNSSNLHVQHHSNFPDPSDPFQHPLAPLAEEELQQRAQHLKKVQVTRAPRVYHKKLTEDGRAHAIGSRKRSRAKVWIGPGQGNIVVNGRPWVDYFPRIDHRDKIIRPFTLLGLLGKMDVECSVRGGGPTGQAEAMRHGIARALQNWDPSNRPAMKSDGLLTRDQREVERKKYGRTKARKSPQWVKR